MPRRNLPVRRQTDMTFSERDKRALTARVRALRGPARSFVSEIFRQARRARGRLDDDVYGILQATLEALQQTGGTPPPLIFGVSHYETGEVEQVGFLPPGVTRVPPGGRFITNHPGVRPADVRPPIPPRRGGARRIEG